MENNNNVVTTSLEKPDRKTQEKNRRIQMKYLSSKLFSLIPPHHHHYSTKDMVTQQDQIDQAITYIEKLKERVDVLKRRKDKIIAQVRELGSTIEVILVSCLKKKFTMQEVIIILEQEGAQVVTANFSTIGNKVYYTIHAQVKITRLGVDASRVYSRLQNLIC
ncbi:hypothetical protein KY284_017676 [Solanum tuberosum]|nr:hypothetical protein KY284_017676 [Solanum tuberosum]